MGATMFGTAAHAQESTTYRYDALGRLIQVNVGSNALVEYSFDAAGSRQLIVTTTFVPPANCNIDIVDYGFTLVKYGQPYSGYSQIIPGAGCTSPVTISNATQDGTAIYNANYVATSGLLSVSPGQSYVRYPLSGLAIGGAESLEFYVNFAVVSGNATLSKTRATIWLNAD